MAENSPNSLNPDYPFARGSKWEWRFVWWRMSKWWCRPLEWGGWSYVRVKPDGEPWK